MPRDRAEQGFTTYYNAACPVCAAEVDSYRRYAERLSLPLGWVDVDQDGDALRHAGLSQDDLKRRLHVITPDGRLLRNIDAFAALWEKLPRYRWLARLVRLPVVKGLASVIYEHAVAPAIYRWARARTTRAERLKGAGKAA